ncbi:hypothetical protein LP420_19375 [Massilia sp. B-10]|nr:hypothetical protein LP420_19375 [Massilia sp. B-10]
MPGLDVDLQRDRTAVVELVRARVLPCGTSPGAKTWPKLSGTSLWPSLAVLSIARLVRAPFSVAAAMQRCGQYRQRAGHRQPHGMG